MRKYELFFHSDHYRITIDKTALNEYILISSSFDYKRFIDKNSKDYYGDKEIKELCFVGNYIKDNSSEIRVYRKNTDNPESPIWEIKIEHKSDHIVFTEISRFYSQSVVFYFDQTINFPECPMLGGISTITLYEFKQDNDPLFNF